MDASKEDNSGNLTARWRHSGAVSLLVISVVAVPSVWWLTCLRHASQPVSKKPAQAKIDDDAYDGRYTAEEVEAFEETALYGLGSGEERWHSVNLSYPVAFASRPNRTFLESATTRSLLFTAAEPKQERYEWLLVNGKTPWSRRYAHGTVLNNHGEIFVMGGATMDYTPKRLDSGGMEYKQHEYLNDVWHSADSGQTWEFVIPRSPRFAPRRGHATVMNANRVVMFVLGGFCGKACFLEDWWSSQTGAVWNSMGKAPWSARHGHAAIITSKEWLVVFGGHDGKHYQNDVWEIQDPSQALVYSQWQLATPHAEWHPRYGHAAVVDSDDAIILFGGFFADKTTGKIVAFNDVWRSEDGGHVWNQVSPTAPWSGRYQHASEISTRDEIFLIGGLDSALNRCGDAWRSRDMGQTWVQITSVAAWSARYEHTVVLDPKNDTIFILGGVSTTASRFGDVWQSRQTCADEEEGTGLDCETGTTCRDDFKGLLNAKCFDICDRRIFDDCAKDKICVVKKGTQDCVNPCVYKKCGEGLVCGVSKRGELATDKYGKVIPGQNADTAEAYCLKCKERKSKDACNEIDSCDWNKDDEVCSNKE